MIRPNRLLAATGLLLALGTATPDSSWGSPASPGQSLPDAPSTLGLRTTEPTLAHLRAALEQNRRVEALRTAQQLLDALPRGRQRDAVQLAVGWLHREAGRHNLASEAFTSVRQRGGPLAAWGAWFEAEQDLQRDRPRVAAEECEAYRRRWPEGVHAGACLRLMAVAWAREGEVDAAREAATAYDEAHELGPITEQVELAIARRWLDEGRPEAIGALRALALQHTAPLTGRLAEQWLEEAGASPEPTTPEGRIERALSLRDARRPDEAWAAFDELRALADDQPEVARFVGNEAERFGWRTRNWGFLDTWYTSRYAEDGDPRDAWVRYRVLVRAGRHADAADLAERMQRRHADDRSWQRSHEDVGRTMLLAGRYEGARGQFDRVGTASGATGRRGRFFAAFATLMAGHHRDAIDRLSAIVEEDRAWLVEARYWRARALDLVGRPDDAEVDRAWVLEREPDGWYAALLRDRPDEASPHAGRWVVSGPRVDVTPLGEPRVLGPISAGELGRTAPRPIAAVGSLTWPWVSPEVRAKGTTPPVALRFGDVPPASYLAAAFWDPAEGAEALSRFANRFGRYWTELRAIEDLATVGLYDLSGPLMSQWYEQWRRDYRRNRNGARRIKRMTPEEWRTLFLAARDDHHAARTCYGAWDDLAPDVDPAPTYRLAYPVAHGRTVWSESEAHDVDPFLVLGLMRQESTYDATAVSRVGARGAMQIMPRTGHLLADRIGDTDFTAADLEEPELAIGYGIRYLGLLLDRFDGVFPLAVAAYNAGPFNVSSWLEGTGPHLPIDALVEHIPFRETRDYVKRVTANYDSYVRLYGPPGSRVDVPPHAAGDHREVVDF